MTFFFVLIRKKHQRVTQTEIHAFAEMLLKFEFLINNEKQTDEGIKCKEKKKISKEIRVAGTEWGKYGALERCRC